MKREDLFAPLQYNLVSEMERYAKDQEKVAVKWENEDGETKEITYEALMKNANKFGNVFLEKGLKKGDVVLIIIPRLVEAYEVYLPLLKLGFVVIPCSEMLRAKDLQYRINHGDVKAIISYYPYIEQFESIAEMDHLVKFVVGNERDGWDFLDEEMKTASDELALADTSRMIWHFYPIHLERQEIQRVLCIHMAGHMRI